MRNPISISCESYKIFWRLDTSVGEQICGCGYDLIAFIKPIWEVSDEYKRSADNGNRQSGEEKAQALASRTVRNVGGPTE